MLASILKRFYTGVSLRRPNAAVLRSRLSQSWLFYSWAGFLFSFLPSPRPKSPLRGIRDFRKADATIQTVRRAFATLFLLATACLALSQDQQPPAPQPTAASTESKPQVKVNYLNVCTPGTEEQAIIKSALAAVQPKPVFSADFEISRGRTSLKDAPDAKYVRLRRDFAAEAPLLTAQYSMSTDTTNTIEILVLRARDPRDFLQVVLENRVTAGAATPL